MRQVIYYPKKYTDCYLPFPTKLKTSTITATYNGGGFPPGYDLRPTVLEIKQVW